MVKWIKGRPYLYEQTSYRVGGKVRTESRYIGPADAAALGVRSDTRAAVAERTEAPPASTPEPPPAPRPTDSEQPDTGRAAAPVNLTNSAPLRVRVKLAKYGISETALAREHQAARNRLARLGVAPATLPEITIKHGSPVRVRRRLFGRGYVVTLPRWEKGNRSAFKEAFSKAVARGSLDALRTGAPERFTALAGEFDTAYRETTVNLTKYLMATSDPVKLGKVVKLWLLGYALPIAGGRVKARTVGLVEYGRRAGWQDEAAALLGEVQRKGYAAVQAAALAEYGKARAEEANAAHDYRGQSILSISRGAARRRYKRAAARLQAQALMLGKLRTLAAAFDLFEPSSRSSSSPRAAAPLAKGTLKMNDGLLERMTD